MTHAKALGLSYRMVAPSRPDTPWVAREWVASILRGTGFGHLVEAARLCTSELVTNAYRHTPTEVIGVGVDVTGGRITVEVCDSGPPWRPVGGGLLDVRGRGLALVGAYCEDWTVVAGDGGTVVWFRLGGGGG